MNIAAPDENRETALSRKHKPDEANQQLQESGVQFQAVLQDLFTQAPALIGLLQGREHRWTYVNDELVRLTGGQDPAKLLGRTLRETFPAIEDTFLALLEDVYESGRPYAGREVKITLNRGTSGETGEGHFDFVLQPVRNSGGSTEGIFLHAVEVSDRVAARQRLEQSEQRLRLTQAAAQVGTWEWDPVRNTSSLSPDLHRIFGTDPNDPNHVQKWAERVHPEDWEKLQRDLKEAARSGDMEFEYRYRHPQNGLRWFFCRGQRFGHEPRMVGVVLDVTERKRADEAQHRLAAIVASSDDAIISKNLRGIVTSWNAAAERIFGYKAEEIIGRPITTIIPPELHSDEDTILATIASGKRIEHFETVRITKNGERVDVSLTISPVKDESGRTIGAAKIARDITERKKTEQALHTTERLASVGRLAATVAHEINNPLEAVTNLIYLAQHSAISHQVRDYLKLAEEELIRVSHLTKQTLGFYRDSRAAAPTRLGPLITSLTSVFASKLRNKEINLISELRQDPEIVGIPGELRQLIANLVSNSIDAVPFGGRVRIRLAQVQVNHGQSGVRLTVADSGPGIPAAVRARLYEPFFTTKKDVGTGLGLWISKSIVEKHGGTIRMKSSAREGKSGTVFSVFLPAKAHAVDAAHALKIAV